MESKAYDLYEFAKREDLVRELAHKISQALSKAIRQNREAFLAVSGGSTPKRLFHQLASTSIAWEYVRIILVDERWVDHESDQSNEKLVRDYLLQDRAKKATLIPLKTGAETAKEATQFLNSRLEKLCDRLDVVLLGMGTDGHTASFFPGDEALDDALTLGQCVCATTAPNEPKERITLCRSFLLSCRDLFLHIEGTEKKAVFEKAVTLQDSNIMPIFAMMQQENPRLKVYYAD